MPVVLVTLIMKFNSILHKLIQYQCPKKRVFTPLKTKSTALESLNKEESLGKIVAKKDAGKTILKPSNCLTLTRQIRIFSKKPLEGSSGLGNSFSGAKIY